MNEFWGKVHFGLSFLFMNLLFMPMFYQGMEGLSRRMYDGGARYAATPDTIGLSAYTLHLNIPISHAAWALEMCIRDRFSSS